MDNIVVKKNKSLKCGSAIKVLSIISLICTVLSCISYFFYYKDERNSSGWNGAILGDSTPYYEYFEAHKTFELTINEDNTFTLNVPKLTEIYDWYHSK